ncbi:hypothetical protein FNF31_00726 [Cafeteria roenbergensis]|uniref:Ubiquitin-like domain-containing protein n=1 Tax=Cafeteria roenbergensis TaxID=33653 RepID=A0A5A8DVN2_CAFRO|nr:hypothetical protein FNF31_00726 [Cafeteria roenbergensis]
MLISFQDGETLSFPRDAVRTVGELRQAVAMMNGCSPEGVLLATSGTFMGSDDVPLDALGVQDSSRVDCALTDRGQSFPAGVVTSTSEASARGASSAAHPSAAAPPATPPAASPGPASAAAASAAAASPRPESPPQAASGSRVPTSLAGILGDDAAHDVPPHLREEGSLTHAAALLLRRLEPELREHGDLGCTSDGALTLLYSAGCLEGEGDAGLHTCMTRALKERTLEWAALHPTAHFAVSVATHGAEARTFWNARRVDLLRCMGAQCLGQDSVNSWCQRGWWEATSFEERLQSSVRHASLAVVAVGQSALGAWDLAERLKMAGFSPTVHAPPSCLSGRPAADCAAMQLLRARGYAVQAFPTWFPHIPMAPMLARSQWAAAQPFASWDGASGVVPALSFANETDTGVVAPLPPASSVGAPTLARSQTASKPAIEAPPDTTVAPSCAVAHGGYAVFAVAARPAGEDPGTGTLSPEAAAVDWDLELADGVDGDVPMQVVRDAIERALVQGDAADGHPAHYDLTERGLSSNDLEGLDLAWLEYRRGRKSADREGVVARGQTLRQATVLAGRLREAGLLATLCADSGATELTEAAKGLKLTPRKRVLAADAQFLGMVHGFKQAKAAGTDMDRHPVRALRRLDAEQMRMLRTGAGRLGELRGLVEPTSFKTWIKANHAALPGHFQQTQATSEEAIASFKRFVWSPEVKASLPESMHACGIMLCEFEDGEMVVQLPCDHVFSEENILTWLADKMVCPGCRRRLPRSPNRLLLACGIIGPRHFDPGADPATGLPKDALPLDPTPCIGELTGPAMRHAERAALTNAAAALVSLKHEVCAVAAGMVDPSEGRWDFAQAVPLARLTSHGWTIKPSVVFLMDECASGAELPHLSDVLEAGGEALDMGSEVFARRVYELVANQRLHGGSLDRFLLPMGWAPGVPWNPRPLTAAGLRLVADPCTAPPTGDVRATDGHAAESVRKEYPAHAAEMLERLEGLDGAVRSLAAIVAAQNKGLWESAGSSIIRDLERAHYEVERAFHSIMNGVRDEAQLLAGMDRTSGRFPGNKMLVQRLLELVEAGFDDLSVVKGRRAAGVLQQWDKHLSLIAVDVAVRPADFKRELAVPCSAEGPAATASAPAAAAAAAGPAPEEHGVRFVKTSTADQWVRAMGFAVEDDLAPALALLRDGRRSMDAVTARRSGQAHNIARRLLELTRRLEGAERLASALELVREAEGFAKLPEAEGILSFFARVLSRCLSNPAQRVKLTDKTRPLLGYERPHFREVLDALGFEEQEREGTQGLVLTADGLSRARASLLYLQRACLTDSALVATSRPWF